MKSAEMQNAFQLKEHFPVLDSGGVIAVYASCHYASGKIRDRIGLCQWREINN